MPEVKTYSTKSIYKKGLPSIFSGMFNELKDNRDLLWQLFKRDFKARYKQSLLGWLWVIISPLTAVGTFFVLNKSGVVRVGNIEAPYVLYGLIGITFWEVFSTGLSSVTASITSAGNLIQKTRFPNEVLLFSALGQVMPSFFMRTVMIVILSAYYHFPPSPYTLLFPILLVPISLLTLGIGFITSLFNVVIRDVANLISSAMSLLLFLTPIMYALPRSGLLGKVSTYNPLFYLITVPRDFFIYGRTEFLAEYLFVTISTLGVFLGGWIIFHISQHKLIERL